MSTLRSAGRLALSALALGASLVAAPSPAAAATPAQVCESRASAALKSCGSAVARQQLRCVQTAAAPCAPGDAKIASALASLEKKVLAACPDPATLGAAGYGAALTPAGLVAQLQGACQDAPASLVARSFGGPQLAVRKAASPTDAACLDRAYTTGRMQIDYSLAQQRSCLLAAHGGRSCDPATVASRIATRESKSATQIAARCADLAGLVALDPSQFVARASAQSRCMTATAFGSTAPLSLDCGPRAGVTVPPPATPTQIVLDGATTGTRCGDGSPFALWIRLAPAGQPVNKVLVFLPGGGQCASGADCKAKMQSQPDLFESVGDTMSNAGINSSTDASNPFRDWTKVFLPYCTQDVHIGGGIANTYTDVSPPITVYRHGAVNVRAGLQYARDVLWTAMNASDPDGFRPDKLQVVLSGSSAGGGGASFNYQYVLDDLRWIHTTQVNDSAMAIDNGRADGVIAEGAVVIQPATPGWASLPFLPPYCHTAECAEILTNLQLAHSPRLEAVPEQQILNVANQVDGTERKTQNFLTNGEFVNALRAGYCAEQGANGIHSFFSGLSTSVHGLINGPEYNTFSIGGTLLRDWIGGAANAPSAVIDEIATGTIVPDVSGALPFPCAVGSPSGAFLDGCAAY